MKKPMEMAIKQAKMTSALGVGGPFGASIVNSKTGEIVCVASNEVLKNNDPTAHAEMQAIRTACAILHTHDLTGYTIYATGFPCPMCMSAIIWANIDKIVYAADEIDADKIGFRDDFIYRYIEEGCENDLIVKIEHDTEAQKVVQNMYKKYSSEGELY